MFKKFEMELAGRTLRVDVGRVAKQANGAALMHYGDTVVLSYKPLISKYEHINVIHYQRIYHILYAIF